MKRKIYDKLLEWKRESADKYALLVEGARRVGKSWIVEEFAKNEYKKFLIIDFAKTNRKIKDPSCPRSNQVFGEGWTLSLYRNGVFDFNQEERREHCHP